MNGAFLLARLVGGMVPTYRVIHALRAGFAGGSATISDYPRGRFIGVDQYTDCVTFQVAILGNDGPLSTALAPRILSPEGVAPGATVGPVHRCAELKSYLDEGTQGSAQLATYTRFWQGPATFLSLALAVLSLDGYRALLLTASFGVIALCAVLAALKSRDLFLGLSPLLLFSFVADEQVGFGQLVSHAPSCIASWSFAALLIACKDLLSFRRVILLAVAAGSTEAFVDFLISVPMSASIFIIVSVAVMLPTWRNCSVARAAGYTVSYAGAWYGGFLGTYVSKLALTIPVLGWSNVVTPFLEQLRFRMSTVDPSEGLVVQGWGSTPIAAFKAIGRLAENVWMLGYTEQHRFVVAAMLLIGGCGWAYAIWRVLHKLSQERGHSLLSGLGYVTASLLMLIWVVALPEHTWRHFWFMIRSAMIWLPAGWGWAMTEYAFSRKTNQPTQEMLRA